MKDGDRFKPFELDALCWIASCTKILTAVSALQCVERGQFTLDEDVIRLLPELKDIQIQTEDKNGTDFPVFAKAKNKITLRYVPVIGVGRQVITYVYHRRLLNHTSGLAYRKFGDLSLPLVDRCLTPLLFEPGEGFIYGSESSFRRHGDHKC